MAGSIQPVSASLIRTINRGLTRRERVPPPQAGEYIRASGMDRLCMREEVLVSLYGIERVSEIETDLRLIFDHGTALHNVLQNNVLPMCEGVLWGHWRCPACGGLNRADGFYSSNLSWAQPAPPPEGWSHAPAKPWRESVMLRPEVCSGCQAPGHGLLYEELDFISDELLITGHCDGPIKIEGMGGWGCLEAKSIGNIWAVRKTPLLAHVIQLHLYMMFMDVGWGVILYWHKGTNGIDALVEHFEDRDEGVIEDIRASLLGRKSGLEAVQKLLAEPSTEGPDQALLALGEALPERICVQDGCPRALSCPVREQCFREGL